VISVLVPQRLVSGQPGGSGPVNYVKRWWPVILASAKGWTAKKRAPSRVELLRRVKAKSGAAPAFTLDPEEATQRISYHVVYPAWTVDLQGEYATGAEVETACHSYRARGGKAGEMHARVLMDDGEEAGLVVEEFVARRGDPDFPPEDWCQAVLWHPEVWGKVKSGAYKGVSIEGVWRLSTIAAAA
jgi:hypothetical protein